MSWYFPQRNVADRKLHLISSDENFQLLPATTSCSCMGSAPLPLLPLRPASTGAGDGVGGGGVGFWDFAVGGMGGAAGGAACSAAAPDAPNSSAVKSMEKATDCDGLLWWRPPLWDITSTDRIERQTERSERELRERVELYERGLEFECVLLIGEGGRGRGG